MRGHLYQTPSQPASREAGNKTGDHLQDAGPKRRFDDAQHATNAVSMKTQQR